MGWGCTVIQVLGGIPPGLLDKTPVCDVVDAVTDPVGSAVGSLSDGMYQFVGQVQVSAATWWLGVPSPDVGSQVPQSAAVPDVPAGLSHMWVVWSWVSWLGLVACVIALIITAALMALRVQAGSEVGALSKVGMVLLGAVLICGAGGVGAQVVAGVQNQSTYTGVAGWIRSSTWPVTGALLVLSIIVAGVKLAIEERGTALVELVKELVSFSVVATAGAAVAGLLLNGSDVLSGWIVEQGSGCTEQACFALKIGQITDPAVFIDHGLGSLVYVIVLFIVAVVQAAILLGRYGLLVVMIGLLPMSASLQTTATGQRWFQRVLGYVISLILYKPVAALIYATMFQLVGSKDSSMESLIAGLLLMVMAIFALPAMMRVITPTVGGAMSGSGGGGVLAGAAATGAMVVSMGMSAAGGGGSSGASGSVGAGSSAGGGAPSSGGSSGDAGGPSGATGAADTGSPSPSPSPSDAPGSSPGGGDDPATQVQGQVGEVVSNVRHATVGSLDFVAPGLGSAVNAGIDVVEGTAGVVADGATDRGRDDNRG